MPELRGIDFARDIATANKIEALKAMEITPDAALKMAETMASYGRASVVLTRTELEKLFGANVNVVRAEYIDSDEILLITIEKEGLPMWHEGSRPYRVSGRFTDGSYIMADVRGEWADTWDARR